MAQTTTDRPLGSAADVSPAAFVQRLAASGIRRAAFLPGDDGGIDSSSPAVADLGVALLANLRD